MGWVSAYIYLVHDPCISNIQSSANLTIVLKSFQLFSSWKSLNITNSITNSALFIPSHDIKIKLITLLHSNSSFFFFFFWKERKENHSRCSKKFNPLPLTKILHCPQCIKAKINLSIKGRGCLKHLIFFFFLNFFHTYKC